MAICRQLASRPRLRITRVELPSLVSAIASPPPAIARASGSSARAPIGPSGDHERASEVTMSGE